MDGSLSGNGLTAGLTMPVMIEIDLFNLRITAATNMGKINNPAKSESFPNTFPLFHQPLLNIPRLGGEVHSYFE